MTPLKEGDPCRVRLHTGEVVEAVYLRHHFHKLHQVYVGLKICIATGQQPSKGDDYVYDTVRFVGPACDHVDIVPMGVSV